jgi:Tfp pilus assembly protein PilP
MSKHKFLIIGLLTLGFLVPLILAQTQEQTKQEQPQTIIPSQQMLTDMPPRASYDPGGRRDPFKDLLGNRTGTGKTGATEGILSIDNATLVGIVKTPKGFVAIVSGPQEFPYFLKVGDKLSDGYVLTIDESKVVFRKTHDRGFPLIRPRNVVKEINPEER